MSKEKKNEHLKDIKNIGVNLIKADSINLIKIA